MCKVIIALVGSPRTGKDMVASHLAEKHGFHRFAFADEIKRQYYAVSGHSDEEFKAVRGTPLEDKIRQGLWEYSDWMKREKWPLYFVNIVVGAIRDCVSPVVVTDVRTRDELVAMRAVGAQIVLVVRLARDEVFREPHAGDPIPGTRLTYGDLGSDRGLFVNRENSDSVAIEAAIEEWYASQKL
jgi:hypothetical protein